MEEIRIVKIRENVFHIYESLGVWCTLITGSKAALLIDTGFGFGDISGKVRAITDRPVTVINTHGHVDHIQGNKFFDTVLLHENDRKIIKFYSSFLMKLCIYLGAF
jgi:glyoxylase-like metal-dependent hydrolase (beta-lactamase superfamily II)